MQVNRDELDAFFAKAEDVLTNWRGSEDAMHAWATDEDDHAMPAFMLYPPRRRLFHDETRHSSWRTDA
jgi:hypothetical protein